MKRFPSIIAIASLLVSITSPALGHEPGSTSHQSDPSSCSNGSCGHDHGNYPTVSEVAGQWIETLESSPKLSTTDRSLVEALVGVLVARNPEHYRELAASESQPRKPSRANHHHEHVHEAKRVSRWLRPLDWTWRKLKSFGSTVKHFAKHQSADIAEGLPEFGITFAAIVTLAEAIDHLVLDEFIPVIGQIPLCVLIADTARRASTFMGEARSVWWNNASWRSPLPRRALLNWRQARVRAQSNLAAVESTIRAPGRSPISVKVKRPSFLQKVLKTDTIHRRIASTLGPHAELLMSLNDRTSSAWREVVRLRLGDPASEGRTRSTRKIVGSALSQEEPVERVLSGYEAIEVMQQSKGIASSLVMAGEAKGLISWGEMMRMRWRIGRMGGAIRSLERKVLAQTSRNGRVTAGEAQRTAKATEQAVRHTTGALKVIATAIESGTTPSRLARLSQHRDGIRQATRLIEARQPRSHKPAREARKRKTARR